MYMHRLMCTWCGSVDAVWVCMCMRNNHPRPKKQKSRTCTRGKQANVPFCIILIRLIAESRVSLSRQNNCLCFSFLVFFEECKFNSTHPYLHHSMQRLEDLYDSKHWNSSPNPAKHVKTCIYRIYIYSQTYNILHRSLSFPSIAYPSFTNLRCTAKVLTPFGIAQSVFPVSCHHQDIWYAVVVES